MHVMTTQAAMPCSVVVCCSNLNGCSEVVRKQREAFLHALSSPVPEAFWGDELKQKKVTAMRARTEGNASSDRGGALGRGAEGHDCGARTHVQLL